MDVQTDRIVILMQLIFGVQLNIQFWSNLHVNGKLIVTFHICIFAPNMNIQFISDKFGNLRC